MNKLILSLIVGGAVSQIAAFNTTIYLHRGKTHRSITFHHYLELFFRFLQWITTGIITKEWVAVHRKHHAFTDKPGDPHSPKVHGFWQVQIGNYQLYNEERKNEETLRKYASDLHTPDFWDLSLFDHGKSGVILGTAILCLALGPWGLVAAVTHLVLYVFVLSPSINGLCHTVGYKNFPTNTATNIRLIAWITGGEGLHNNHHRFPASPRFSFSSGEFDPSWPIIKLLSILGLAKYKAFE